MKSATDLRSLARGASLILGLALVAGQAWGETSGLREETLRRSALAAGLVPAEATWVPVDPAEVEAGRRLFQSRALSLGEQTACASCHLDRFGSADGLPVAIGTGGVGEGAARFAGGGDVVPRNVLPLWGRGGRGFEVFFWDGKASRMPGGEIASQFGDRAPSADPLAVAAVLPPVEIGEMIADTSANDALEGESVEAARAVYDQLLARIRARVDLGPVVAQARSKPLEAIDVADLGASLAAFIRHNFRLQETRFHRFVFAEGALSREELQGGLIYYGKGGCVVCHSGPYLSDLDFHAIPYPQVGFGKNGFGIDYGRFNVTLSPEDRWRFRTPPLWNVARTAPYSHSGGAPDLAAAIRAHLDPLAGFGAGSTSGLQRTQFYEQLRRWSSEPLDPVFLDEREMAALVAFLGTLTFDAAGVVRETP